MYFLDLKVHNIMLVKSFYNLYYLKLHDWNVLYKLSIVWNNILVCYVILFLKGPNNLIRAVVSIISRENGAFNASQFLIFIIQVII